MSDKGLFASICDFFKGLFSSSPASSPKASVKSGDGLTSVERYIRSKAQSGASQLSGVERYIRNKAQSESQLTGVERYVRSQSGAKKMTGVERYIQSKG